MSNFATPWAVAEQAPLSMGFSRQEYRSGLPCPPPGDFLTQGSNGGLLHCRRVFYQLSCQGSLWLLTVPHYRTVNILQLNQQLCC